MLQVMKCSVQQKVFFITDGGKENVSVLDSMWSTIPNAMVLQGRCRPLKCVVNSDDYNYK